VHGGTLGGNGSVGGGVNVAGGVLRPGLAADEAAQFAGASVGEGNVLNVGGDVTVGRQGRVAVTISGDRDHTSVRATGALVLDGELDLDVRGTLTPGTVFTIMSGSAVKGAFHALPREPRPEHGRAPVPGVLQEQQHDADRRARAAVPRELNPDHVGRPGPTRGRTDMRS